MLADYTDKSCRRWVYYISAIVIAVSGLGCLFTKESLREGNVVLVAGGAMSSPRVEDWSTAWNAAGPHPAAVLDPMETADFVERVLGEA